VQVIYAEIFFEQLYDRAWLFRDVDAFLSEHGFKLCGLSNIVHAADGDLVRPMPRFDGYLALPSTYAPDIRNNLPCPD
jgi:hypothetical protein